MVYILDLMGVKMSMKILNLRTTDGPNYWSIRRHQLVIMTLDLEEMEDRPTHLIPGFYDRMTTLLPTLYQHRCSAGEEGGFLGRVQKGTWMGHVIEHIALEIQTLAGMNTGFGRTRGAGRKGVYHVVFSYMDAEAGRHAAYAAVRIAGALIAGNDYNLRPDIAALAAIYTKNKLGPTTEALVHEARKKNIPVLRLNDASLIQLGYGASQRRIEAALASTTSHIAVEIAADKDATRRLLAANGIPVAKGNKCNNETTLLQVIAGIGYPVVIKPLDGNHGKGVTINISDEGMALQALLAAKNHSEEVICEQFIKGHDFRALVIDGRFIAAALRKPASVTGDGLHSIQELIDIINRHPDRADGHDNILTRITIDSSTLQCLRDQGYTLHTVPPDGKEVHVKGTANLSTGGTAMDVTDDVHPSNRTLFERIARLIGLDICGIDIMAPSLSQPLKENGGVILEVNAGPGLRMHLQPSHGQPRNVAAPIIDMLFPPGQTGRIPIISITGTNGKTTTTRLIAHIGRAAGYKVGCTTTDGIYIGDQLIETGDCTGPHSARTVLRDPWVDLAVLECARGGLLREGLGFDRCNIAVITNVAEDHLGMDGIDTLEKLARVKGVLAESVAPDGYAVLNADDDYVYQMKDGLSCKVALFSLHAQNPRIREHVRQGGLAAINYNGYVCLVQKGIMNRLKKVKDIPLTFGGDATFNTANILAATLAAHVQGISAERITAALTSFIPSPLTLPGRMNIFNFGAYKVIADYAHNAHGLQTIAGFLKKIPASLRLGVIAGVGDRRDQDIISLGAEAARIFDEIIIRLDKDLRGRTADELISLLTQGIRHVHSQKKITVIPDEKESILTVLRQARRDMVATIFVDDVTGCLQLLQHALDSGAYTLREKIVA